MNGPPDSSTDLTFVIFFSLLIWIFFKHFRVADLNNYIDTYIYIFFLKYIFVSFAFSEKAFLEMLSAGSLRIQ